MTLLAGLAVGVFVYFLVGYATGYTPEIKIRRFRRRAQISNRQLWLNQAGVAVTPRQFIAGSVAVGAVAFVAIVAVTGAPLVALVPAAGVAASAARVLRSPADGSSATSAGGLARWAPRRRCFDRGRALVVTSAQRARGIRPCTASRGVYALPDAVADVGDRPGPRGHQGGAC